MSKQKFIKENNIKPELQVRRVNVDKKQQNLPSFQQNFKIYLRVKPLNDHHQGSQSIKIINKKEIQIVPPYFSTETERIYEYQQVFDQNATNHQVFLKTMQEPINNVLQGYNSTIFIYGMTGAGKTHTMFKSTNSNNHNQGLVCMSIDKIFEYTNIDKQNKYEILLSFYEIYNENIRDLLTENNQALNIMQDNKGMIINDLKQYSIINEKAAKSLVMQGLNKRSMNATKNNQVSSRSHAILQFTIRKYLQGNKEKDNNQITVIQSKLFMIDLAGNEKACQNQNKRFIQGININKSLLTLGKCINILSEQKKANFIPFRDSKLTRILKDSLGGNSKTVMLACVSSENKFYQETLNTLKYSNKAKKIQNKGKGGSIKILKRKEKQSLKQKQNQIKEAEMTGNQRDDPCSIKSQMAFTYREEQNSYRHQLSNCSFNTYETLIREKITIQKMIQQLQICYADDEKDIKMGKSNRQECLQNMKDINQILPKLKGKLQQFRFKILKCQQKIIKIQEQCYKKQLQSYKNKINQQSIELEMLKQVLDVKDSKILTYPHKNINQIDKSHQLSQMLSDSSINNKKMSSYHLNNRNHILIDDAKSVNNQRSARQTININLMTCRNNSKNKENLISNNNKRVKTPQSSLKSSKILSVYSNAQDQQPARSNTHRFYTKPTLDVTMDNIKLNSPQTKMFLKHSIQDKPPVEPQTSLQQIQKRKQQFTIQLRQIDKNVNFVSQQRIGRLLQQYQKYEYELNKTEKSIMNKIKFTYKTTNKTPLINLKDPYENKHSKVKNLIK